MLPQINAHLKLRALNRAFMGKKQGNFNTLPHKFILFDNIRRVKVLIV